MRYNRNETFRYAFKDKIPCTFQINTINNKKVSSKAAAGNISDLSLTGINIESTLDLKSGRNDVEVDIKFSLLTDHLVTGKVVWQKEKGHNIFTYGITLNNDEAKRQLLVNELKTFIRQNKTT